jgi:putative transposase
MAEPYAESFGGRLHDECLGVELFATLLEATVVIEDWRIDSNTHRPHSSLGARRLPSSPPPGGLLS